MKLAFRVSARFLAVAWLVGSCSHELSGPRPSVDQQDHTFCGGLASSFVLRGGGFSPLAVEAATDQARVELPRVCFELREMPDGSAASGARVCLTQEQVSWISPSEMRFEVSDSAGLGPGLYEVVVINPDGQEARNSVRLRVLSEGPLVFFSDPPVTYNGISTQTTVHGAGLAGGIASVFLRDSAGTEHPLDWTVDPARPNRFRAVVAKGTAVGSYDVVVKDANGCAAELKAGLRVTDSLTLGLADIEAAFGAAASNTAVTISGTGFQSVPRAYLNPQNPTAQTVATALTSVAFIGASRLTAVVPSGLPAGTYDLVVVNPDGAVGLLKDTFRVTQDAPPVVESVSPSSLDNDSDKAATITGTSFRGAKVSLRCKSPDGNVTTSAATVGSATATRIDATLPVRSLPQGTVCIVRVENSDGSYFDHSAVGITNPASNLSAFATTAQLGTARRAPAVTAARATHAARFLYALGGDSGADAGALATVESAPVDIFGGLGSWFAQPVSLPGPRTRAAVVRIGSYLYLVGGHDGQAPTATVHRALVLSPAEAPEILDVGARRGQGGAGIGAGVWYYRVSAVMADTHAANPGGETLASDPLVVSLPPDLRDTVVLTVTWRAVPAARSYRIYRSPAANQMYGAERLLAEIPATTATAYEDASGAAAGKAPLPLGATGVWVPMPAMMSARASAGVNLARDPADASKFHIFAVGGRNAAGAALASGERLTITVGADGSHSAGVWTAIPALPTARAELGLYAVSRTEAPVVAAGSTVLYAGGDATSTSVEAAVVGAGGTISGWSAVDGMSPARGGYGAVCGAGFLFAFGGQGGRPSDGGVSAELDAPAGGAPPALNNWNNQGERLTIERYLMGITRESAFIFLVGGHTQTGPTRSVERTVL
jgi:hypothetical protein